MVDKLKRVIGVLSGDESSSAQSKRESLLLAKKMLSDQSDRDEMISVLRALIEIGIDQDSSSQLYDYVIRVLKSTRSVLVAHNALTLLTDMAYYHNIYREDDMKWLISEHRVLNKKRRYKLDKSDLICQVLTSHNLGQELHDEIELWILSMVQSSDEEYIDILSFCIGNREVAVSDRIAALFREYIKQNYGNNASTEMAVTLARKHDPFLQPYINQMLESNDHSESWVKATVIYGDKELISKLIATSDTEMLEEYKDELGQYT